MRRKSAVIFDLDGTLVDSLEDIAAALNAAMTACGRSPAPPHRVRAWIGDGLPTLCRRAAPDADADTLSALVEHARTAYHAHVCERTKPYPNVQRLLDRLKRDGTPMAVLSNKPHDLVVRVLRELGLADDFAEAFGYTGEQDKKPSPEPALRLAARFQVEARRVYLVGDSPVDVQTARNAKMRAVAVAWGFCDEPDLLAAGPDFIIHDPLELIPIMAAD